MFWRKKNQQPRVTYWRTIAGNELVDPSFQALTRWQEYTTRDYTAILGWQDNGDPAFIDFATAPHALIAGTTGSGKSVGINTMLASLLVKNSPATLQLLIIDPKMVDYMQYQGLPHVKGYGSNIPQAQLILSAAYDEMIRRYGIMQRERVNHIDLLRGYPHILVVFDEFASLMSKDGKRCLLPILQELARLGRAAGVHLILATQRPTRDAIDGQLKSNCPARIAYRVSSATDSRVILDTGGAELLRGKGDGLYHRSDGERVRFRGYMTTREQLDQIINHYMAQNKASG